MKGVSVIVCCYNSATRITETLQHLLLQKISATINWEVIVVNNASSDNTLEVAKMAWAQMKGSANFVIVDQPISGLASARKKGIEVSQYDFLIFCDDDNHFEPNYVEEAFKILHNNPSIGIAGGWIKPKLPFYPGKWIESNYAALAIGRQSVNSGFVDWVFGAGMVFRKRIFTELNERHIKFLLTGRLGSKQTSGDDAEMCRLVRFIGYKIYYSNELILHHQISAHRLTRWSFVKANFLNVFHAIYFYLLEKQICQPDLSSKNLYLKFLRRTFYNLIYFFPRVFLGKNNFFSFIMFFQNVQVAGWLLAKRSHFNKTYKNIKTNLYH